MRKGKRAAVIAVAGFLAMVMLLSVVLGIFGTASAVTQSQIDALKENAAALEQKQAEIQAQIDSRTSDIVAVMAKYELLEQQVDLTRQEIENLTQQIQVCEEMIAQKEIEYDDAVAAEEEQMAHLKTRVRAMEENGTVVSYLEILFQARSFSDLLARLELISAIMASDQRLADELAAARVAVAEAKTQLEQAKNEYETTRAEEEAKQAELQTSMAEAQETMDYLQANLDELTAAYEANEAEEDKLQSEIDDLMEKLKAEEEARKNQNNGGNNSGTGNQGTTGTGQYIWPATSSYITSSFGTRWHPVLGGYRTHYGVDIGASYGTNIYAADSGTVEISTYSSSYGNYVLINHGGGNATLYAHMSTRYVEVGDSVSQGDVIGLVGSTGISTGPHLHFEVRENGTRVDPMKYFS